MNTMTRRTALMTSLVYLLSFLPLMSRHERIAAIFRSCRVVYSNRPPVTCNGPTYVLDIDSD